MYKKKPQDKPVAYKAYKYRLYPNDEQAILINKTCGSCRFYYNHYLSDRNEHYKKTKQTLKKEVSEYKKKYPFLKEVDSLALANAKVNLETAFKNFFNPKLKAKHPTFKKKGKHDSYTTNRLVGPTGCENICIVGNGIKLPKLGVVKTKLHRAIGKDETIKSCTVSIKAGKYYVSVLVEYHKEAVEIVKPNDDSPAIGFDFSVPHFYVDSENRQAGYPKYYGKSEQKLAKAQRKLSKCKYKSNNYYKQLSKVQKIQEYIANQRKDFIYKKAKELIDSYNVFCFEDLDLSNMKRMLHLGKSVSDNGFGMFRTTLERKALDNGKLFIKIDKWFPSTKRCHCCGYVNKAITLSTKEWTCTDCGTSHLRDYNAAINIRNEGLRLLLENA